MGVSLKAINNYLNFNNQLIKYVGSTTHFSVSLYDTYVIAISTIDGYGLNGEANCEFLLKLTKFALNIHFTVRCFTSCTLLTR